MTRVEYNREKAVAYAMKWWNRHNPAFPIFSVDCTNYVSQCLYAGGVPMWGASERETGWWSEVTNWSLSWSVAHSFYWYFLSEPQGVQATEVKSPTELYVGDVICYDFEGDNRWDHVTIVVDKNKDGTPLVNAHTDNSLRRNWEYRDSAAYTMNIKYAFIHLF